MWQYCATTVISIPTALCTFSSVAGSVRAAPLKRAVLHWTPVHQVSPTLDKTKGELYRVLFSSVGPSQVADCQDMVLAGTCAILEVPPLFTGRYFETAVLSYRPLNIQNCWI